MITDTQRLDFLERNLLILNHAQGTNSVYMGGERVFGQLVNEARGSGAGPGYFTVRHQSIREAVDDAINWKQDGVLR